VNVNQAALDSASGEETLDAEWTTGLAPDAKIRIYASGTLQFTDLDLALDRLIDDLDTQPQLHQLSISLGLGEQQMVPAEIDAEHARFVRLVALGVNVFVSSGDEGSHPNSALQVEYESSDPYVVAVGGTSMRMTATGAISDERGWNGSGGGVSDHFPRPAFQSGAGVPQGSKRCVPDVSLTADPNTGGYVVLNGTEQQYGGTSWSAPMWAAICALANEARANAGKPALPMVAPLLYPLNGGPCFRDITNGFSGDTTFSDYNAGPGYDLVTGLGVPDIKNLIDKLAQ
jgi:kumamolisin